MFICSSSRLQAKLDKIRSILVADGYSDHIITSTFTKKIGQFNQSSQHGPKKCPVYLHLPWLGNVSTKFKKQITTAIRRCSLAVETCVVFTTRPLLLAIKKNVLSVHHHNNVIYQFMCHCDRQYVGRTSQRLQERIKQHVPRSIRNHHSSQDRSNLSCACKKNSTSQIITHDSAIGQHLLKNPSCASQYSDIEYSTLARAQFSILYPRNRDLDIFNLSKNPNIFLCSKNSHSALYSLIIFIFRYVCKSIIFIFRYICKRYI